MCIVFTFSVRGNEFQLAVRCALLGTVNLTQGKTALLRKARSKVINLCFLIVLIHV